MTHSGEDRTELEAARQDWRLFAQLTGLCAVGNHHKCFACERRSLSVHVDTANVIRWKCHRCGESGDVFDAFALLEKCSVANAMTSILGRETRTKPVAVHANPKVDIDAESPPLIPVPDRNRLFRFQERAIENVMLPHQEAERCAQMRGLNLQLIGGEFCVGFMSDFRFTGWRSHLRNAWCFPIPATPSGPIVAVKVHFEEPPWAGAGKGIWAPFGTEPKEDAAKNVKPKHGLSTLWPCPEWFPKSNWLFICPGELKALAVICSGHAATSPTAGESLSWPLEHAQRFARRRVAVVFDDDEAGHSFRERTVSALGPHVRDLRVMTFGRGVAA